MAKEERWRTIQEMSRVGDFEKEVDAAIAYDQGMSRHTKDLLKSLFISLSSRDQQLDLANKELKRLNTGLMNRVDKFKPVSYVFEDLTGLTFTLFRTIILKDIQETGLRGSISRKANSDEKWLRHIYDRIALGLSDEHAFEPKYAQAVIAFNAELEYTTWVFKEKVLGTIEETLRTGIDTFGSLCVGIVESHNFRIHAKEGDVVALTSLHLPFIPHGVKVDYVDLYKTHAVIIMSAGGISAKFVLSPIAGFNRLLEDHL